MQNLNFRFSLLKYFILIVFFLISDFSVFPQTKTIDSLQNVYDSHKKKDKEKVIITNKLSRALVNYDWERAREYSFEAKKLAEEIDYTEGVVRSLTYIGQTYIRRDNKEALSYYKLAYEYAESKNYKKGMSSNLNALGNGYELMGMHKKGDSCYQAALVIAEEIEDKSLISTILINQSNIHSKENKRDEAIASMERALKYSHEVGSKSSIAGVHVSLGILYLHFGNYPKSLENLQEALRLGEELDERTKIREANYNIAIIKAEQKEYHEALEMINNVLNISIEMKDSLYQARSLSFIGATYQRLGDDERALDYTLQAMEIYARRNRKNPLIMSNAAEIYLERSEFKKAKEVIDDAEAVGLKIGSKYQLAPVYIRKAQYYQKTGNYNEALKAISTSLEFAKEIKNATITKESYEVLSEILALKGDYKKALENHIKFKEINDSLFNDSNVKQIARLEESFAYEKEKAQFELEKVANAAKIKEQRIIMSVLSGIFLLSILLLFFMIRSHRLKKRLLDIEIETINRELEKNQKELAAGMLKLVQNAEQDNFSIKELEDIESNVSPEVKYQIRSLINSYKRKSNDNNWSEFEVIFSKVSPSFYSNLNNQYPTLTPNERKLCVFLKLNMSNKDIAQITFQSEDALKKARMRLRKKIGIEREENLMSFIQGI